MSCLDATFTLTPLSPRYSTYNTQAVLDCYGADFMDTYPLDLSSSYAFNRFFFDGSSAGDPNLDYTQYANRRKSPYLYCYINLQGYATANKQLALIFGFDVSSSSGVDGRVLVYTDNGLLPGGDQTLVYGDHQFLLEIDSLDQPMYLYFIHAGGYWFFRGLSGYVI